MTHEPTHPDGAKITFTIVDIRGDKVQLGITAPVEVSVHREEVQESIERHGPNPQHKVMSQP